MVGYFRDFQENSSLIPSLKKHEQQMAYTYTPGTNRFPHRFSSLQVYNVFKSENAFFYYYDFLKKTRDLKGRWDLIPKVAEMDEARGPSLGSCGVYVYTHLSFKKTHTITQVDRLPPRATHSLHSSSTSSDNRRVRTLSFLSQKPRTVSNFFCFLFNWRFV